MQGASEHGPETLIERPGPARLERYAALLLAALAILVWAIPLVGSVDFSYDDKEAIVSNPVVTGALPAREAFDRDYWHHLEDAGHYRPLATLLLRHDHERAGGAVPATFRWTNVLLHALIVGLLAAAWRRLSIRHGLPFPWFGLAVLAVHPACADVVAWISGRTSLVSGLGAAAGIILLCSLQYGSVVLSLFKRIPVVLSIPVGVVSLLDFRPRILVGLDSISAPQLGCELLVRSGSSFGCR